MIESFYGKRLSAALIIVANEQGSSVYGQSGNSESSRGRRIPGGYKTLNERGVRIFYREAGPKKAPVILLLHGNDDFDVALG
jgi:hypothetical protein